MKLNRYIAKGLAVMFLLMLGQKFGVGLFLHNVLHLSEKIEATAGKTDSNSINYACNCIDDFSSPFTETASIELHIVNTHPVILLSYFEQQAPVAYYLFNSLRAPPVSIA